MQMTEILDLKKNSIDSGTLITAMISIGYKKLDPLCRDFEFVVNDKQQLAELISKLVMGWSRHVSRLIKNLDPHYPDVDRATIQSQLNVLKGGDTEKIDGWLFQMISWIVLAEQHKDTPNFFQNNPHPQKAMHGLDGIAVTINPDGSINRIIITEDKCTDTPRNKITQQVFPEFLEIEAGKKNNAIMQQVEALLSEEDLIKVQNDIVNPKYRQYRISITRLDEHDSDEGRKKLFKDYEQKVDGVDIDRRTCSSTNFNNMRAWMDDLKKLVIASLTQQMP